MKKLLIAAMLMITTPVTAWAGHEEVMSYIESDNAPYLADTTAYVHGTVCSRGERPRDGIAASAPEYYGSALVAYEAIPDGDGYRLGDFIRVFEILDCGYGKSTGNGIPSKVRPDKKSQGTIEIGKSFDIFCESEEDAAEWMRETGGKIFVQVIREPAG